MDGQDHFGTSHVASLQDSTLLLSRLAKSRKVDPSVQISPLINGCDLIAISHFASSDDFLLDRSISRNHEMLILHHASFPVPTARIDLAISDLCLTLNLVQLYDPDHPMVVDLICLMDLRHRKLILLARLIWVDIRLLQVLRLVLTNAACVVYLNDWLRARENKRSATEAKREKWSTYGKQKGLGPILLRQSNKEKQVD
jgi:hypothetical protein